MIKKTSSENSLHKFLDGRSAITIELFQHFIEEFKKVGPITLHPAKTMIGIATPRKRIAYIIQLGKNFIHVVFPFTEAHSDNLCFQKIAKVPGAKQFNHHFRMMAKDDINAEVKRFMRMAVERGS